MFNIKNIISNSINKALEAPLMVVNMFKNIFHIKASAKAASIHVPVEMDLDKVELEKDNVEPNKASLEVIPVSVSVETPEKVASKTIEKSLLEKIQAIKLKKVDTNLLKKVNTDSEDIIVKNFNPALLMQAIKNTSDISEEVAITSEDEWDEADDFYNTQQNIQSVQTKPDNTEAPKSKIADVEDNYIEETNSKHEEFTIQDLLNKITSRRSSIEEDQPRPSFKHAISEELNNDLENASLRFNESKKNLQEFFVLTNIEDKDLSGTIFEVEDIG